MPPDQPVDKPAWRKLQRRRWLESYPDERRAACTAIAGHLHAWLVACPGRPLVLWYSPLPDELDLGALAATCRVAGLPLALPRVEGDGLGIFLWDGRADALAPGAYGIAEPDPARCPRVEGAGLGVAVIPGLGFDPASGIRLGRGAGYYDRLLARPDFAAITIGVAAPWHLAGPLPGDPHDRPMDYLATVTGVIRTGPLHAG